MNNSLNFVIKTNENPLNCHNNTIRYTYCCGLTACMEKLWSAWAALGMQGRWVCFWGLQGEDAWSTVLLAALEQFEYQATNRLLLAASEEYGDSGTTQKKDVKKTPAKMLPPTLSKHCMCTCVVCKCSGFYFSLDHTWSHSVNLVSC